MTPDDLDMRLRRAFDEVSAWQPSRGSTAAFMTAVSRRRASRQRRVVTIGCAVVAVVAVTVGAGGYSTTSRTEPREAASGTFPGSMPSTGSASVPGSGLSKQAVPSPEAANLTCASVTVGSGVSQCAGQYFATPQASPGFSAASSASTGLAAPNRAAGKASTTPAPASVSVEVGQRITVDMPPTNSGTWGEPVVVAASGLPATLRHRLPLSHPPAHPGAVRVVDRARAGAKQSVSVVFEATKAGGVVLTATLGHCVRTSEQAKTASPSCPGTSTRWLLLLLVLPR